MRGTTPQRPLLASPRLDRGAYQIGQRVRPGLVGPPVKPGEGRRGERGAALLAVLWFVAAVSSLAIAFSRLATADRVLVVTQADAVRARALARDGLARAVLLLNERGPERPLPRSLAWTLPGGEVVAARLEAESGKVDLNAAAPELVEALAQAAGLPRERAEAVAAAVVDWRDPDEARGVNGAERREYEADGRVHPPANKPFRQVEELRYVLAVDNDAYARLAPHLTVFGKDRPDARLAGPVVRAALGLRRADSKGSDGGGEEALDKRPRDARAGDQPPAGPTGTPQPSDGGGEAADGEGGGAGGAEGMAYAVLLDVRLPEGYETHARAVIALASAEGGSAAAPDTNANDTGGAAGPGAAFRVLDWASATVPAPTGP